MQFRNAAVVAVALLVALSGCSALGGTPAGEPANETDTKSVTEPATDGSADANTTSTAEPNGTEDDTSTDRSDDTTDAAWYPPEEPNRPLEDKREDRIESVTFVDKVPAESGDGYSNFNLEVVANTSMEDVDPAEHGDLEGEPYFFVKINEGEDNRKIIERTDEVRMDENGTFHIDVRPAGIEEFGAGPLTVEVFLMDEDKDWDDIYASVGTEIQYTPDTSADGSNSTATDSESTES
ncbi:hypothetical protein BDK88_0550 [Natrinema hispanicum]|uniref:Uncharacterized protein n=1 Tax=Natrinema hispanicum TaxID=392421 RepID=A0A482YFH3_9EURY|nr:hypothetical protein [Natrinema hispanicum]RZV11669.1 hypothetical protein BDK88_0550 [Natrinema hispanicum]